MARPSPYPHARPRDGVAADLRAHLRATRPARVPDRTVALVARDDGRHGAWFRAAAIRPALIDCAEPSASEKAEARRRARDGLRKKWLRRRGVHAARFDERALDKTALAAADGFFDDLVAGQDVVARADAAASLRRCGAPLGAVDALAHQMGSTFDREAFRTLFFHQEAADAFLERTHRNGHALTAPLWAEAHDRRRRLDACYAAFAIPDDDAPEDDEEDWFDEVQRAAPSRREEPAAGGSSGPWRPSRLEAPARATSVAEIGRAYDAARRSTTVRRTTARKTSVVPPKTNEEVVLASLATSSTQSRKLSKRAVAYVRRADVPRTSRGDAAVATWRFLW